MTIQIIGGGAVGLLLAGCLVQRFEDLSILTRRPEQKEHIQREGIVMYAVDGEKRHVKVTATESLSENPRLVIIATKYQALKSIYPLLTQLPVDVPLLFIQNGLAHYEEALLLPQQTILFGSAQFGAQRTSDVEVHHRGIGVLKLAVARGKKQDVAFLQAIEDEHFPLQWLEDAEAMLFEKALLNCFINPLTAILQVKNGVLVKNEAAAMLLQSLYEELILAFPAMKEQFPFQAVCGLCERTAENTSSMLADRLANCPTEVDTIVGAVLQKGLAEGAQMPILQTLYQLLKALEQQESGGK